MPLRPPLPPASIKAPDERGKLRHLATLRTVAALMLREMATRYGRSPGGYLWAVLDPLGTIVILGFGFSMLIANPSLGSSFLLFYATGFIPFNAFQTISLTVSRAVMFSRPLLLYPAVTWLDAVLARFLLNALTAAMVAYLVLAAIFLVSDTRTVLDLGRVVVALLLCMFFALAIGVLNCALIGLFPVWDRIWSLISRPLFLISGVLFLLEDLPRSLQAILWYNPLIHLSGLMRQGFYPMYHPDYVSLVYVAGCSLVLLSFGMILMHRHHRDILSG